MYSKYSTKKSPLLIDIYFPPTVRDHHSLPVAVATSVMCLQLIPILLKCNVPAEVSDHERTLESDPDLLGPQLNDYASLRRVT